MSALGYTARVTRYQRVRSLRQPKVGCAASSDQEFAATELVVKRQNRRRVARLRQQATRGPSAQLSLSEWHQHPYLLAIAAILIPEQCDHVTLFQGDSDKDVGSRHGGEEEMAVGHRRRRPERDDEAEIDWMPHHFVKQRSLEVRLGGGTPTAIFMTTCCKPDSSKWLIRKVLSSTMPQPRNEIACTASASLGSAICQTTSVIGRHCHISRIVNTHGTMTHP